MSTKTGVKYPLEIKKKAIEMKQELMPEKTKYPFVVYHDIYKVL